MRKLSTAEKVGAGLAIGGALGSLALALVGLAGDKKPPSPPPGNTGFAGFAMKPRPKFVRKACTPCT